MNLVPCTPEHIQRIPVSGIAEMETIRAAIGEDHRPQLAEWARTMVEDSGELLAIFGVSPRWAGVGEAWIFITDYARQAYPVQLVRNAQRCIDIAEEHGMRRIQAAVIVGFEPGHRFIQKLGFEPEGTMRRFGVGGEGDYTLYARIH